MSVLAAGTRLGPYDVLAKIGEGGMGEVYRARDTRLDRTVAIKVLADTLAGDADRRGRFEREARAVAMLDHPHVCGIYDVGNADGTHYLVMPHLEGETLAARLERGALPLDLALRFATDIADALQAAHRVGVIHRDLKPANIFLVRRSGASTPDVKLLDFGLAKLRAPAGAVSMSTLERGATTHATAQGTILGTVQYMSPEQVEGREADQRSDLWALGVVIYQMISGSRPFGGDSPASLIGSILKDTPAPLSARQPLAPVALDHLVATCLAKDPEERWQSAADVKRQLEWIARNANTTSPTADAVPRTRRLLTIAIPVAVASLMIGWLGGWFAQSWRADPKAVPEPPVVFTLPPPEGTAFGGPSASTSAAQLSLSPDGRRMVFVAIEAQGQSALWLRTLNDPVSHRIASTEGAIDPFWSPDGTYLGFFSGGIVKITAIDGTASPQPLARALVDSRGAAWRPDGSILFYAAKLGELSRVAATGGDVTPFAFPGVAGMVRWAEFLPDGHTLLYQLRNPDASQRGVYATIAGSNTSRRLVGSDWTAHYSAGHLLFLDGTTLMAQPFDASGMALSGSPVALARDVGGSSTGYAAFSASRGGVLAYAGGLAQESEIRWVGRTGAPGSLVVPRGDFVDLSLSPDETRVAYSLVDPQSQAPDIWILDLVRGTKTRLTLDRLVDASPRWSPNGDEIVFRSNRSSAAGVELFRTTASPGGRVERILGLEEAAAAAPGLPSNVVPSYWSPDGHVVFFEATVERGYGIWTTSVTEKNPTPIVDTQSNEVQAAVSPDGRWMAYASDQSGRFEIYVQDFPKSLERTLVSTNGGLQPQWRGDGRELFYLQSDGSLMQVPVKLGARFDAGAPTALFKTAIPTTLNPYRMDYVPAADGQRFLMKVPLSKSPSVITVVLNWPALLAKTPKS